MSRHLLLTLLFSLFVSNICHAQQPEDILGKALGEVGFTRSDLGFHPQGYWSRFPLDIPHKLTSFDALFAEPLKLYDYSSLMGNAAERYLNPAYRDSSDNGLYQLVYTLGVDKKRGGFRSYSANLKPTPDGDKPLVAAIEELYRLAGRETEYMTFGEYSDRRIREGIETAVISLPDSVRSTIAELVVNLADAIYWHRLAFRNCKADDIREAISIRDLDSTQGDGQVYYPVLDDIAKKIDWSSLHYASLKSAAAVERAEQKLFRFRDQIPVDYTVEIDTPFGKLAIFSSVYQRKNLPDGFRTSLTPHKAKQMAYDASNTLLVIDFGRDMTYFGTPGASASPENPVSVLIDLDGDDTYGDSSRQGSPSAGVGLLGVGIVLDSNGNDHYFGGKYAQGAGLFGVGVLLDRTGDDHYRAEVSAQGCGYFGIGLCLDGTGNDEYYLCGDGQGMGGVGGGIGVLASFQGDDKYTAEPYAEKYDRGDYHSEHRINGNSAQGVGFGRRGDGSDGHAWAGGMGAIIDIHGNDHYYSGNWSLGCGYWYGTGIALDKNGDDRYESCYFTQGSGAHFCNGILIDEAGNDRHELFETAGAALGFGWDFTNALLIDKGGNDLYRAKVISMALAQIRSVAFLIDIGGDDRYYLGKDTPGLGEATWREGYDRPQRLYAYNSYASSFGGFIDIGGSDSYYLFKEDRESPHPSARDNSLWLNPTRSDSLFGARNYGVGIDSETGTIPELFKWE
jgi:hypothetical protein